MSKKKLRKVHLDNIEYIYVIKKGDECSMVNVWLSGDKSNPLYELEFEEYTQITPSKVKEKIQTEIRNDWYSKQNIRE